MSHQRMPLPVITGLFVLIFVAGCASSVPTPASQVVTTPFPATPGATTRTAKPPTSVPLSDTGLAGVGDPYYALLGNSGYDVVDYAIVLNVDPTTNTISGTTFILAQAMEPLNALHLDLQGLTVDAVHVNAKPAVASRQDHELTVTPQEAVATGTSFSISVTYHGHPEPIKNVASKDPGVLAGWFHSADGSINILSEPNGAASWYPVNDHPRDKATYHFEITVPKPWVVAASGSLRETRDQGTQTQFVWDMDKPMASYLASINVDKYTIESTQGPGGIKIRHYLPPRFSKSLKKHIAAIPAMIKYFDEVFGAYPFDEYGIVIANGAIAPCKTEFGGSLEVQTMSVHCPNSISLSEEVIAHELAHQWFGDDVSLKNWQDIWLKEGLATYAQWLWQTRNRDLKAVNAFVKRERANYYPVTKPGQPPADDLARWEIYTGGALTVHALRLQVGDAVFFKILRTYLERYRYGNAGTDEFIALAEEISGQELSAFFDSWLLETTLPAQPEVPK